MGNSYMLALDFWWNILPLSTSPSRGHNCLYYFNIADNQCGALGKIYINPERWYCESAALNMPQIWKTQQWPQDWKRSVFIPIPKKGNAKECSNYHTIALISHASKVMLKILQTRLQQYVNREIPDVQVGFRKGRGTRDQIANIPWIMEKAREFQKTSISALLTMPKPLTVWITINCGIFSERDGNTRPPDLPLEKFVCRSGSNS